ncbi:RNA-directed DNA polymerase [Neorhizobium huautlense]|uniref:RNA-directed DNA polymerase n=1 Tax=Neorhizobium huautlense TaxID=67774 RepID=UPI001300769D|nr:RNA-directed DNA polymerase [Neorhizobium huautlense]
MSEIPNWVSQINKDIHNHSYLPNIVHGYLGVEKHLGVTRFIPVLTKEDLAVFYQLCGEIGDAVIENLPGVYGGWRSIPTPANLPQLIANRRIESIATLYQQNYYSSTFSNAAWFQEFRSFNELITSLVKNRSYGRYVIKTDIANFYDSIDVGRLSAKLRQDAPTLSRHVEILDLFLSYWNRRTAGYQRSTKGIPQEIISDGSRNLSHYYLLDFDKKIIGYCTSKNLKYIRWADDILIFGNSVSKLEAAVHNASKFLLADGLNLSAQKTALFSTQDYGRYRGLTILQAVERKDQTAFQKEIRAMQKWSENNSVKRDTIFRAAIGFTAELGTRATSFERNFLQETVLDHPELIGGLNTKQMLRLISSSDKPLTMFNRIANLAKRTEITAPKANLLMLIRDAAPVLTKIGISRRSLEKTIVEISAGGESDIITSFCAPAAMAKI